MNKDGWINTKDELPPFGVRVNACFYRHGQKTVDAITYYDKYIYYPPDSVEFIKNKPYWSRSIIGEKYIHVYFWQHLPKTSDELWSNENIHYSLRDEMMDREDRLHSRG